MNFLSSLQGWGDAHPTLVALIVVPLITALFNLVFKPQTPEEYARVARISPRLAAFLQLMGALGVDPAKAVKIVAEKILKGPPKPPQGPSVLPPPIPPPRKTPRPLTRAPLALAGVVFVISLAGCSLLTKKAAKNALDATAITCIFATELTNESAVADVCGIARELIPIVRNLIGQREAARRSGVHWPGPADAGAVEAGAE